MRKALLFIVAFGFIISTKAQGPDWHFHYGQSGAYFSIFDLQIDKEDNIYSLASIFPGTDIDPGPEEMLLEGESNSSLALLKFRPDGSIVWGKSLGSLSAQLRLSPTGEIILGGAVFKETQLDGQTFNSKGKSDFFLAKLSSEGDLLWGFTVGSEGGDESLRDLAVDAEGNILIYGEFMGDMDVDPSEATVEIKNKGYRDVVLLSYSPEGKLNWETHFGSRSNEFPTSMSIDHQGRIHIIGSFLYTFQMSVAGENYLLRQKGLSTMFWACVDQKGEINWIKNAGGPGFANGGFLKMAPDSSFWLLTSFTRQASFAFEGASDTLTSMNEDAPDLVLAQYDSAQNLLQTRQFRSESYAEIIDFDLTRDGRIYLSGNFRSNLDIDWTAEPISLLADTLWDGFVMGLRAEDQSIFWLKQLKGPDGESINSVREDRAGNIYLGGTYMANSVFDPEGIQLELENEGFYDALMMRFPAVVPQELPNKKSAKKKKKRKR